MKYIIPILLFIGGFLFWFLNKKTGQTTTVGGLKTTVNPNGTITTIMPNGQEIVSPTNPQIPSNPTNPTTKATNKLGLTYEGQSLYKTFNGYDAPANAVGYLINGSLILVSNTEYRDGEYKKRNSINSWGVNLGSVIGLFLINGTNQYVYLEKTGVSLSDYYQAAGFLADGTIVYREIMNEGTAGEYFVYRT